MAKLGDFIVEITDKTTENNQYPVLTSSREGLVEQNQYFNKQVASKDNTGYKIIHRGQFTYRAMSDTGKFYINQLKCSDIGIVSPAYPVFEVKSDSGLCPEYLQEYFRTDLFQHAISLQSSGSTRVSLKLNKLKGIDIVIPSMERQNFIVNILAILGKIIENRRSQLCLLDELIKSRFVEMFGDPVSNPNSFVKKRLKDTCVIVTGNTPSRAVIEYYGDYIEWIKTDNIVQGILNPTTAVENLSEKGAEVGKIVEKNAILMACIAGSVASIGKVCITDRAVAFNQQINAILPKEYNVLFLYVLFQISNVYLVEDLNMALKGILSKSRLESKEFIVPPLDLQNQFADFVAQVDKSKLAVQKSLEQLEILKKSLMQAYFG